MLPRTWSTLATMVVAALLGVIGTAASVQGATGWRASSSPRLATDGVLGASEPAFLRTSPESIGERSGHHSSKAGPFLALAVLGLVLGVARLGDGRRTGDRARRSSSPLRRQLVALRAPPAVRFP